VDGFEKGQLVTMSAKIGKMLKHLFTLTHACVSLQLMYIIISSLLILMFRNIAVMLAMT